MVNAWDAYCEDSCSEIADYLVRLHLVGKLKSVHVYCIFQDSFRDMYNGTRRYYASQVHNDILYELVPQEILHKTVLVY